MAKASRLDQTLEQLAALREAPLGAPLEAALREGLRHASFRVVLAAAGVVEARELEGYGDALVEAFSRLLAAPEPAKSDPGCRAKVAVVRALLKTEAAGEARAYQQGVTWVQREKGWGGATDTAGELRGHCAVGLVRCRHGDAVMRAAELLADPERAARIGAAEALGEAPGAEAAPLLRYKLLAGDADPEVEGAVFGAFLGHEPQRALELAPELLAGPEERAEAIALALGASRRPEALEPLRAYAERTGESARQTAYVAMALLRDDAATAVLLEVVRSGPARRAAQALKALAHFRHDPKLTQRAREAARGREEPEVVLELRSFEP